MSSKLTEPCQVRLESWPFTIMTPHKGGDVTVLNKIKEAFKSETVKEILSEALVAGTAAVVVHSVFAAVFGVEGEE